MDNSKKIQIQDTAFVTSSMRATNEALSKDCYAKLWETEQSKTWMQAYANTVSHLEPVSHCFRNRFFYETISTLAAKGEIEVLLNLGCGFSMYPYILKHDLIHIELDQPDVIQLKELHTKVWIQQGKLPQRSVQRIATDFNANYEEELKKKLESTIRDKKVFILLEGVLYFISRKETLRLFKFIRDLQEPGDYLGSVSFQSIIKTEAAYNRMVNFSLIEGDTTQDFNHHTIDDAFYWSLPNYKMVDRQDFYSSNQKFGSQSIELNSDDVINEHYYLLQRKN